MLVFRKSPGQVSRRATCQIRRWIRTAHDRETLPVEHSEDAPLSSERKVTVTKINFTDLPKNRVLPDGSNAVPIGEWLGGLEDTDLPSPVGKKIGEIKRPRKRGRKKNDLATEEVGCASQPLAKDVLAGEVKRKARQKTKETKAERSKDKSDINSSAIGAKTSSRKSKLEPTENPVRGSMLNGVTDNLAKFPHCLLLTRVGQFYESYFDQAVEISRLLNIKLTSRPYNKNRIPMCGFPLVHLDKSLKVLVQQNQRFVAMCEEFPRFVPGATKPEFDRRVTRVITPGTLIDESFLNQYENNYLLSISAMDVSSPDNDTLQPVGLAWIDVSTGEFFTKSSTYEGLRDELVRIGPKEIVLDKSLESDTSHPIRMILAEEGCFVSYITISGDTSADHSSGTGTYVCTDNLTVPADSEDTLTPLMAPFTSQETSAIKLLTIFLHANLLEHMPTLFSPNRENTEGRMQIDSHTIRALEIRDGASEGTTKGSLLSVIKRTVTRSGTRLLARWLCSPSTSIKEINARQSLVGFFYARPHLRDDILQALSDMEDASRIVQKFLAGRGDANDLAAIHATILIWSFIKKRFELEKFMESKEKHAIDENEWASLDALISRMSGLRELADKIGIALRRRLEAENVTTLEVDSEDIGAATVNDDQLSPRTRTKQPFAYDHDNWTIKPEFSEQLISLHSTLNNLLRDREKLEHELQIAHDVPSLTLRASPGQGMHVHIQRTKRDQSKLGTSSAFVKIAESGTTSSFFYQPWAQLGGQIVDTTNAILVAEREAFELIRSEVNAHSTDLRRNARIMDELDVTLSFANLATEMNFCRPLLKDENVFEIVNGRHPTVELGLLTAGRVFTSNSLTLIPSSRLHIITGPNMAGKSTFLRQAALVTILAQTGSFVPADYAVIGIVDKLFSRVGAKDDLFRDKSTFLVEMLETAEILKRATPKSLVIMDEVGRGTTVKDGMAIAFATVHHLVSVNRCRALFATHFHDLADMLGYSSNGKGQGIFEDVGFFCTDVDETDDGRFAYSHRMRPGVNRDSHGLKVAQLAGMPESAVAVAKEALSWMKKSGMSEATKMGELALLGQTLTAQKPQ